MGYPTIFFLSFTIAFSGALTPGPLLATIISESTRSGFKSGPLIILGHALLEITMLLFVLGGIAHFLKQQVILKIIYLLGISFLFYYGFKMLKDLPKISLELKSSSLKNSNLILLGITTSLSNPYWTIWWLTIGLGLVLTAKKIGLLAVLIFFLGHILADFSWYSFVSLVINQGKGFICLKVYKAIVLICALGIIGFALLLVINIFYSVGIKEIFFSTNSTILC
ncbi:MAG: LysE family translocator [Candidatus Omnitrophica bacterium]|nr:LysE family translocator [Candidatus Omnitrophota bacterium]